MDYWSGHGLQIRAILHKNYFIYPSDRAGAVTGGIVAGLNGVLHEIGDGNENDNDSGRNPKQDKKLTEGDIQKLKDTGWDHSEKGVNGKGGGPKDLYKDKKGNVYEKPKGGAGAGEPIGINLNNLAVKVSSAAVTTTVIYGAIKFFDKVLSRFVAPILIIPFGVYQQPTEQQRLEL